MEAHGKVVVSLDRREWRPTPLVEQVVLVSTVNAALEPHVATSSRVSLVSYGPPAVVFFACDSSHTTARNILDTRQFVINVPSTDLVATCWVIGSDPSGSAKTLFEENGLTGIPGVKVGAVRVAECQVHLECELIETRNWGEDVAVFGRVVCATMDERLLSGKETDRYQRLGPFFFLEAGWTAAMGAARLVDMPIPGPEHDLTVLAVRDPVRSAEFYERAFRWPIRVSEKTYVEFELPERRGLALRTREAFAEQAGRPPAEIPAGALTGVELRLTCEDLPHITARLSALGARLLRRPENRNSGAETAYFADPDGNALAISRRPGPKYAG